jgi:hypothetical protein
MRCSSAKPSHETELGMPTNLLEVLQGERTLPAQRIFMDVETGRA